jgi:hypothetical protein
MRGRGRVRPVHGRRGGRAHGLGRARAAILRGALRAGCLVARRPGSGLGRGASGGPRSARRGLARRSGGSGSRCIRGRTGLARSGGAGARCSRSTCGGLAGAGRCGPRAAGLAAAAGADLPSGCRARLAGGAGRFAARTGGAWLARSCPAARSRWSAGGCAGLAGRPVGVCPVGVCPVGGGRSGVAGPCFDDVGYGRKARRRGSARPRSGSRLSAAAGRRRWRWRRTGLRGATRGRCGAGGRGRGRVLARLRRRHRLGGGGILHLLGSDGADGWHGLGGGVIARRRSGCLGGWRRRTGCGAGRGCRRTSRDGRGRDVRGPLRGRCVRIVRASGGPGRRGGFGLLGRAAFRGAEPDRGRLVGRLAR